MRDKKSIGHEIRNLRLVQKMSQTEFRALLNRLEPLEVQFGKTDLSKYETGRVMPPADKYRKIMSLRP